MLCAKDIMTTTVITVPADLPVENLAVILWKNRISGVPVIAEDGNLLGVATESDLIDQAKRIHIPTAISILDSVFYLESPAKVEKEIRKMAAVTVKDICAPNPLTISEETTLEEIATIMAEKKVHTLPVLKEGRIVGIIGKADLIKTMARPGAVQ